MLCLVLPIVMIVIMTQALGVLADQDLSGISGEGRAMRQNGVVFPHPGDDRLIATVFILGCRRVARLADA